MQLTINSYVTGSYQDIEDYIYNLIQRLPCFGSLAMQVHFNIINDESIIYGDIKESAKRAEIVMDYFHRFIEENLEVIDPTVINPNNFWFDLQSYKNCSSSEGYADYILTIKKIK